MGQKSSSTTTPPRTKSGSAATGRTRAATAPHMKPWATTAGEIPVTVRIDQRAMFDPLTALALLDSTALADQLRAALEGYLTFRIEDPDLPTKIDAARSRQDAVFSALNNNEAAKSAGAAQAEADFARPQRTSGPTKPVTVRIDDVTLSRLTALALVDDTTLAVQIHAAADRYLEARLSDKDLAAQIEQARARQDDALSVLSS